MRYIGNKTRLLDFIGHVLKDRGLVDACTTAVDPFSGTAAVGRYLKSLGLSVTASDIMTYGHVFAHAYVEAVALPQAPQLSGEVLAVHGSDAPTLDDVLDHLNAMPPAEGFIRAHYAPTGGSHSPRQGRMYFTPANAGRIDHIRARIADWRASGLAGDDLYYLLLAALLEAADAVANTSGVYAAYLKSWQPNARRRVRLSTPTIVPGNGCCAVQADAQELLESLEPFDLLYLDPPYTARQYPGYYHIPELLAAGWFAERPKLRGKTGLIPDDDKRTDWARRSACEEAFERLVATAPWRHLVMSYSSEGILAADTIKRVLTAHGRPETYERYAHSYRRYRSDSDSEARSYRSDSVEEYLYCISR